MWQTGAWSSSYAIQTRAWSSSYAICNCVFSHAQLSFHNFVLICANMHATNGLRLWNIFLHMRAGNKAIMTWRQAHIHEYTYAYTLQPHTVRARTSQKHGCQTAKAWKLHLNKTCLPRRNAQCTPAAISHSKRVDTRLIKFVFVFTS